MKTAHETPLRFLNESAELLGSLDEPEARLRGVLGLLKRIVPYDACALLTIQKGEVFRFSPDPVPDEKSLRKAVKACLQTLQEEQAPEFFRAKSHPLAVSMPWRSYLGLPLFGNGQMIGLLFISATEPDVFGEQDSALLSVIACQIGAYLTSVDLHEQEMTHARRLRLKARLLEGANQAAVAVDPEGTVVFWNRCAEELFGWSASEMMGRLVREVMPVQADWPTRETLESVDQWVGELTAARRDGSTFPVRVSFGRVVDDSGAAAGVFLITDITDAKREEAAREVVSRTQAMLSTTIARAPIGIALFDRDYRYVVLNDALAAINGLPVEEHLGRTVEEVLPDLGAQVRTVLERVMEAGECAFQSVVEGQTPATGGETRSWAVTWYAVKDAAGSAIGVGALVEDVTERIRAEKEVEQLSRRCRRLFESSIVGTIESVGDEIVDANEAFLRMVGHTREDLLARGLNWRAMTPAEYLPLGDRAMHDLEAIGESSPFEKEYFRKDGTRVHVIIGTALLEKEQMHCVSFVLDLSERKEMEERLERTRSEFLGEVSHELKTPLTAIKGSASMALSAGTPPSATEARELFQVIDEQADRLRELIGNLLDMTRIEAGSLSIQQEPVSLPRIIKAAITMFTRTRARRQIDLTLPSSLPPAFADSRRITQVLTNLLSNAAKASPATEPIEISAELTDGEVTVHVHDQGRGIAPEKLPLLFQKFSQVHESGGRGTGLGLAIAKGIIEAHGGRIWAESSGESRGTTFSFTLPLSDKAPSESEE